MHDLRLITRERFKELDRIPAVDPVHEQLAAWVDQHPAQVVLLGQAADHTPLLAVGTGAGQKTLLLLAGSPGDSVLSPAVALHLLEQHEAFPGWQVWVICALDMPRLRLNEGTLQPKQDHDAHVRARRSAWGPGEDPEHNLPVDAPPFWQPDEAPESPPDRFVPSTPESVALGRALAHLKPDLMIALHETLSGGVLLSASQELPGDDIGQLTQAATCSGLPLHIGSKTRVGRALHDQPGFLILPSLDEERRRLEREADPDADEASDRRLVGGVTSWQALGEINPEAVYLSLDVPRFTHDAFADERDAEALRSVTVRLEQRERSGKQVPFRVIELNQPGHPAHGTELRCEEVKASEQVAEGDMELMPASSGWLAMEAFMTRRSVLREALEVFEAVMPSCQHIDHVRAMQLLREASDGQESLLKSYQQNKRYGRRASRAEASSWLLAYPFTTAAMLAEARHGLEREDARDKQIQDALDKLDALIDAQLAPVRNIKPPAPHKHAEAVAAVVQTAVEIVDSGRPAMVRAQARVEQAQRDLTAARKQVRDLKNMRAPTRKRQAAQEVQDQAERTLIGLQAELERLLAPTDPAPEVQSGHEEEAAAGVSAQNDITDIAQDEATAVDEPAIDEPAVDERAADEPAVDEPAAPEPPQRAPAAEASAAEDAAPASDDTLERPEGPERELPPAPPQEITDILEPEPEREHELEPEPVEETPLESQSEEPADQGADTPAEEPQLEPELEPVVDADATPEPEPEPTTDDLGQAPDISLPLPGDDTGEDEVDLDNALPARLALPSEWGMGPMDWQTQIPDVDAPSPYAELVAKAATEHNDTQPEPAAAAPEPQHAEIERSERHVETVGQVSGTTVGFRRRRVELRSRPREVVPRLATPKPTGGRFHRRPRSLITR